MTKPYLVYDDIYLGPIDTPGTYSLLREYIQDSKHTSYTLLIKELDESKIKPFDEDNQFLKAQQEGDTDEISL